MPTLQEQRKERLQVFGYSMNAFAYNVGIQPSNLSKMLGGTQKNYRQNA